MVWRANPDKCKSRHCHSTNDKPQFVVGDCLQISQLINNYFINVLGSVVKGGVFLAITLFVGFGTQKTDLCSTCLQYEINIKEKLNDDEKADLLFIGTAATTYT
ncbi:hypothetical protein QE152_g39291 [Popillia japonica]|uniref:Uncharacterized protein n=1 Tax=Popillia japonica TaxID=7064 RepID=A0AAW1HTZ7_POPJA